MLDAGIILDPKATPGFIHARDLTTESADAAGRALQLNRVNHIFTSDKALVVSRHDASCRIASRSHPDSGVY